MVKGRIKIGICLGLDLNDLQLWMRDYIFIHFSWLCFTCVVIYVLLHSCGAWWWCFPQLENANNLSHNSGQNEFLDFNTWSRNQLIERPTFHCKKITLTQTSSGERFLDFGKSQFPFYWGPHECSICSQPDSDVIKREVFSKKNCLKLTISSLITDLTACCRERGHIQSCVWWNYCRSCSHLEWCIYTSNAMWIPVLLGQLTFSITTAHGQSGMCLLDATLYYKKCQASGVLSFLKAWTKHSIGPLSSVTKRA